MAISRQTTTQSPDPPEGSRVTNPPSHRPEADDHHSLAEEILEEIEELPAEIAEAAERVVEEIEELPLEVARAAAPLGMEIEDSPLGRWAINTYLWIMEHGPQSTRGRILFATAACLIVLAPSLALLYVSLDAGQEATQNWFGKLGYAGIFLANLAQTATLFIPVPALTAAAQALIVSSSQTLSPFWVGVAGGLGMAIGEITAYVGGMAASIIAREEEIKPPGRLQPLIEAITRRISWLMAHFGMLTLYILSAVPNVFFEVAGLTAGATRYSFRRFLFAVVTGKITRGLLLAYVGEKLIFG